MLPLEYPITNSINTLKRYDCVVTFSELISMKVLVLCAVAIIAAFSTAEGSKCDPSVCVISKNCRCSDAANPLGNNINEYPQLISLTFDEAVTRDIVENYWSPLLFEVTNPDEGFIGGTFFVPHEFTDYQKVNELYNSGFEIGVHSITKNNLQSYWRNANESTLEAEFDGQKTIINKFANIELKHIVGVRTPQLQLAGDASVKAYVKANLTYDSSWPTLPTHPMFPYTLDYTSTQMCHLGAKCPTASYKGFWVFPIIDLRGFNKECNTLATCDINGTAEYISDWLLGEVNNIRLTTKAPITLLINSYWFSFTENSFQGLQLFFKKAAQLKDVFFVSQKDVIEWVKNPIKLKYYQTPNNTTPARCTPKSCSFQGTSNKMQTCTDCPAVYPWLGNPEGNKK